MPHVEEELAPGKVKKCVQAFILALLCGNPQLRGAWVTVLNSLILSISLAIDLLTLQIERLNIINQLTNLGINSIEALVDKVSVDLNLFLGPLQQFNGCLPLQKINEALQLPAIGRKAAALKKKLYDINRALNLVRILDAIKQNKEQQVQDIQDFIDAITDLCEPA